MFGIKKSKPGLIEKLMPIPSAAPDKRYSALFSSVNQPGKPTDWLIQQSLRFITDAVSFIMSGNQTIMSKKEFGQYRSSLGLGVRLFM